MDEKYMAAEEVLKKYGQEHLLSQYEKLSEENKSKLLDEILTLDFNQIEELYKRINQTVDFANSKIEPIGYTDKSAMSDNELKHYEEIGLKAIKEGKLAAVTMAGGQGTRLGHNGPKGTYDIGLDSHKPIFEILCDTLKTAEKKYGVFVTWYIMTSKENNDATVKFFEDHDYFGYPKENVKFFMQGNLPLLKRNGDLIIDKDYSIKEAADGNGCIYGAMAKNGIIEEMKQKGIKWIFIGSVDNTILNMVDPILVGLTIDEKHEAASKSVAKASPKEKVGVFCKINGVPSVIEYSELPEKMAEEVDEDGELLYGEAHIMCNLFSIDALDKVSKIHLPYHVAEKKSNYMNDDEEFIEVTEPNAYKFEAFIFDAFNFFDDISILRGRREKDFAPVKNKTGNDSPETSRELYNNYWKNK